MSLPSNDAEAVANLYEIRLVDGSGGVCHIFNCWGMGPITDSGRE